MSFPSSMGSPYTSNTGAVPCFCPAKQYLPPTPSTHSFLPGWWGEGKLIFPGASCLPPPPCPILSRERRREKKRKLTDKEGAQEISLHAPEKAQGGGLLHG